MGNRRARRAASKTARRADSRYPGSTVLGHSIARLEEDPVLLDTMHRAVAAHRSGNLAEAEHLYRRVLRAIPDQFDALHMLGVLEGQRGRDAEAHRLIGQALGINPQSAEALSNLGNVLWRMNRLEEAASAYERSLAIQPDYVPALSNLGNVLRHVCRFEEALAAYDAALARSPNYVEAISNRGDVLHDLQRYDEALSMYDRALAIHPRFAEAASNRGDLLLTLRRLPEALLMYERALAIEPNNDAAHFGEALCRLLLGDFERGWPKYEWRWEIDDVRETRRPFAEPLWLGQEHIAGKTILLHAEQGLGDTIQFCRYATLLAAKGARVVLEVQPPLKTLLRSLRGVDLVLGRGEELPAFDVHCPIMSLPLAFRTEMHTIPAATPYLAARPERTALWAERLAQREGLKVGLVWAGAGHTYPRHAVVMDRKRSMHLSQFAPLATAPGVVFVSLQKDDAAGQARLPPAGLQILDWTSELEDFADTADLIAALDLVISVDTAVAHLAGALGKPVWLLNRFDSCWRWLQDREDSPWYRTHRIFRQPRHGDWESVIARVAGELASWKSSAPVRRRESALNVERHA